MEFTYTGLNQPIPEEAFRPPSGLGQPTARKETGPMMEAYTRRFWATLREAWIDVMTEPMRAGFTRRFLDVSDVSNGRMSVRWGMRGPKGTMASGRN
jgi:hypothetical protein